MRLRTGPTLSSAVLAWALAATAPPPAWAGDWPQLQNDARRSGFTTEEVLPDYTVAWRFHPEDPNVGFAKQIQPIVAGGKVLVGAYDGRMYALNAADGSVAWSFQAGGPILGSAATDGRTVYFGSSDGRVYAADAATGRLAWAFDAQGPISASPLLLDGTLFIGTRRGRFLALSAEGTLRWQYPAAGAERSAPFLCSAAGADGTVYVANEACTAFAFDAASGQVRWTVEMKGQSVPWWPVVSSRKGVVVFRTQSVRDHTFLREDEYAMLENGAAHSPDGPSPGTTAQRATEQANIRAYLAADVYRKTCWAFRTADGTEPFQAPVTYQAGTGACPVPPVLKESTGELWITHNSYFSQFDGTFFVQTGWYVTFGRMDLDTGAITPVTGRKGWEDFHLVGDESSFLMRMNDKLVFTSWISAGYYDLSANNSHWICFNQSTEDKSDGRLPVAEGGAWPVSALVHSVGGEMAPAAVADGTIYWISPHGLLVALRHR